MKAECRVCGSVDVAADDLRCEIIGVGGLCEFSCPFCRRLTLVITEADRTLELWKVGAGRIVGVVPFEVLESHDGPPLSWDDVLDFQLALDAACCPQTEAAA
jgi:hypothetical protein